MACGPSILYAHAHAHATHLPSPQVLFPVSPCPSTALRHLVHVSSNAISSTYLVIQTHFLSSSIIFIVFSSLMHSFSFVATLPQRQLHNHKTASTRPLHPPE